jgi:nucleotide-binding universal stress UspA family protein
VGVSNLKSMSVKDSGWLFKNIIAAVDGSEYSDRAARAAAQLSKKFNAKLTFVTVLAVPEYVVLEGNVPGAVLDRIYTDSTERANEVIAKATEIARSEGVDSNGQVLSNVRSVVQAIVEYSEREKADLIVLGTRGMSGFKRLLLGSVSSGVANHASCSVLIVK